MARRSASPIVTIDGPSGSGKGTISRAVARHAGWHLLDSGALYRLVALAGMRAGLAPDDEAGPARLAATMGAAFGVGPASAEQVMLDGLDGTGAVRAAEAGAGGPRVGPRA